MQISVLDANTSPLTAEQAAAVNQLVASLNPTQVAWLGGYLSGVAGYTQSLLGLLQAGQPGAMPAMPALAGGTSGALEVTVLYGSQTGNCEKVAKRFVAAAQAKGIQANRKDMGSYRTAQLKKESCLLVIVSTHGEGDPPDRVLEMHGFIHGKRAPKLEGVDFSVLALGDRTYRHFCKIGKDFDTQFAALGANRIYDRVDCDVDYDDDVDAWINGVLGVLAKKNGGAQPAGAVGGFPMLGGMGAQPAASQYDRKNPFPAELLERIVLTDEGSEKDTLHIELSLEGSGLAYLPGDSIGVYPTNHPELVDMVIQTAKLTGDETVSDHEGQGGTLREVLTVAHEIASITPDVVERYANFGDIGELKELLKEERFDDLQAYMRGRDIVDLLHDYPTPLYANDLLEILRKLPARLYSLASSLEAYPEEAHLCVAPVRYQSHGRQRFGVCSTYFAERVNDETKIPVYVHENNYFRLPEDPQADVIMVGPGTGVAPFRAFMQHREMLGHEGRNWLFFGEQHFRTDFLYQSEWLQWRKSGVLTNMHVAFSRDQAEKVYVQHRMKENAAELYEWLQKGASFYVCGDESRMAHDVHAALTEIISGEGKCSVEAAEEYVRSLQKSNRYQRDVY